MTMIRTTERDVDDDDGDDDCYYYHDDDKSNNVADLDSGISE